MVTRINKTSPKQVGRDSVEPSPLIRSQFLTPGSTRGAEAPPTFSQHSTLNQQLLSQPQRNIFFEVADDVAKLFHHHRLANHFVDLELFVDANIFRRKMTGQYHDLAFVFTLSKRANQV